MFNSDVVYYEIFAIPDSDYEERFDFIYDRLK